MIEITRIAEVRTLEGDIWKAAIYFSEDEAPGLLALKKKLQNGDKVTMQANELADKPEAPEDPLKEHAVHLITGLVDALRDEARAEVKAEELEASAAFFAEKGNGEG